MLLDLVSHSHEVGSSLDGLLQSEYCSSRMKGASLGREGHPGAATLGSVVLVSSSHGEKRSVMEISGSPLFTEGFRVLVRVISRGMAEGSFSG